MSNFKVGDKFSYITEYASSELTVREVDEDGWVYPEENTSTFFKTGFCPSDIEKTPQFIHIEQNVILKLAGYRHTLSVKDAIQIRNELNEMLND